MAIYSIRDLEKLTGIKAHTIRIWEQRYGLITPARTETNIRYYTDENLRHLFNIALLNRNGLKISKLAQMTPEEIASKGAAIAQNNPNPNAQIDSLTLAMIDLNEAAFERVFVEYVGFNGFGARHVGVGLSFFGQTPAALAHQQYQPGTRKVCRSNHSAEIDGGSRQGLARYRYARFFAIFPRG